MSCVEKLIPYKAGKNDKTHRFDTHAITDGFILNDLFGSKKSFNVAVEKLEAIVGSPSYMQKLMGIGNIAGSKSNPLMRGLGDIDGLPSDRQFRIRAVAFGHIIGQLSSTKDLAAKHNLTKNQRMDISENGLYKISTLGLYDTIGRDIMYSSGFMAQGKTAEEIEAIYRSVGEQAVMDLESAGLVSINKSGWVINNNFKTMDGDRYPGGELIAAPNISINLKAFGDTNKVAVEDIQNYLYRTPDNGRSSKIINTRFKDLSVAVDTAKFVGRMVIPSNRQLPLVSVDAEYSPQGDIGQTATTSNVLKALHTNPIRVNNSLSPLFSFIKKGMEGKSYTDAVKAMIVSPELRASVFGSKSASDSTVDKQRSDMGKSLSQTTPIQDFLEQMDVLTGDLHFTHKTARNDRLNVIETVLNYQSDNFFSRHVLTSGEYEIAVGSEEHHHMVADVMDQSGASSAEILHKGNAPLDELVSEYDRIFTNGTDGEEQFHFLTYLAGQDIKLSNGKSMKSKSVWQLLDTLNGINSLRNAKNGKIKSTYMTKPDATASGGLITLMQLAGKYPAVTETLKRLGILKSKEGEVTVPLKDMYDILTQRIAKEKGSKYSESRKFVTNLETMIAMGAFKGERDISKGPTMTFIYGQGEKSAIRNLSWDMAESVLESATDSDLSYIKGTLSSSDIDLSGVESIHALKHLPGITEALAKEYGPTAKFLRNALEEEINAKLLAHNNKMIERIYRRMVLANDKGGDPIMIIPPMAYLTMSKADRELSHKEQLKRYGAPLSKVYDTLTDDNRMFRKEFPNETNAFVNPQHMTDAAVLKLALDRTNAKVQSGSMPVHDANNANPIFNVVFQEEYRKAFVEVNREYDFIDQMLKSYESMTGHSKEDAEAIRKELMTPDGKTHLEAKREILSDDNVNTTGDSVFGHASKVDMDTKPETTASPEKKTEVATAGISGKDVIAKLIAGESLDPEMTIFVDPFGGSTGSAVLDSFFENKVIKDVLTPGDAFAYNVAQHSIEYGKDAKDVVRKLEHEVTHFNTVAYLASNRDTNTVKYVGESIAHIEKTSANVMAGMSAENRITLQNIMTMGSQVEKEAELIAELSTNDSFAKELYGALDTKQSSRIRKVIDRILKMVKEFIPSTKAIESIKSNGVDVNALAASIQQIILSGTDFVNTKPVSAKKALQSVAVEKLFSDQGNKKTALERELAYRPYKGSEALDDPMSKLFAQANKYTSVLIQNVLEERGKSLTKEVAGNVDTYLNDNFPMYRRTMGYLTHQWNDNEFIVQMRDYLNVNGFTQVSEKQNVLSIAMNAMQQRNKIDTNWTGEIDSMMEWADDATKKKLNTIFSRIPAFYLVEGGQLKAIAQGQKTLDELIKEAEALATAEEKDMAKSFASLYVHGKVINRDHGYSSDSRNLSAESKYNTDTLTALYGLQMVPDSELTLIELEADHLKLYNRLIDASMALYNMNEKVYSGTDRRGRPQKRNHRGNLTDDLFDVKKQFQVVSFSDMKSGKYPESHGWKVLRHPGKGRIGVVYKDVGDVSTQSGAGINSSFTLNDILVPKELIGDVTTEDNAVAVEIGRTKTYRIVLTSEEKAQLGAIETPSHTLLRSYSKLQMIADTQILRKELMSEAFTYNMKNENSVSDLVETIQDKEKDNPWFLKLGNSMTYDALPAHIKREYKLIEEPLSDANGFREEVDLVRKDISYWLVGYKEPVLFENNVQLRRAADVTKKLVKFMKIHWIINNAVKIAADAGSNITLLMTKNVPVQKVLKYGKETTDQLATLETARENALRAKMDLMSRPNDPEKIKALTEAQKALEEHPLAFAVANGMIQSLSTDIIMKDFDTVTGLQHDIEMLLKRFTRDEKGDYTGLAKGIMAFSSKGPGVEQLFNAMADNTPGRDGKMGEILRGMSKRIGHIKNEGEVEKYIAQFLGSPDSEITRLGSAATQYVDVIPKIILARHLIDSGVEEQAAIQEAMESFIDYKINMPKELKVLSDYGLLMFPSFWLRIQKVILGLGKKNAASVATAILAGELIGEITGLDLPHIVDSNIINRYMDDNIMSIPEFGMDTFFPTRVLG